MKSSLKRKNTVKESGLTDGKTRSQHGWRRCSKFQFIIQVCSDISSPAHEVPPIIPCKKKHTKYIKQTDFGNDSRTNIK